MASGAGSSGSGGGPGDRQYPGNGAGSVPGPVHLAREDGIRIGALAIDPPARRIAHDDGRVQILEPRLMQVLVVLLRSGGRIVSRDELIDRCWGGRIVGDDAISSVIYRLRRMVRDIAGGVFTIDTIAKVGFLLVPEPAGQARRPRVGIDFLRRGRLRWAAAAGAVAVLASLGLVSGSNSSSSSSSTAAAVQAPSIAVLPFADLSPGQENAYFAGGMAEAIMGLLSEAPGLRVIGRTSIGLLGKNAGIDEARTRLGITHVLEGSVRRSGEALRVNVRLIDASDGSQIWTEQFDRSLGDVFTIQDDIAAQVLRRLHGTLAARDDSPTSFPTSPRVYDLYLAAIALERAGTLNSLLRAKALLERAVLLDPDYAPVHARLASYAREIWLRGDPDKAVSEWPASLAHARRALTLAPNLGAAHAAMATLVEKETDWAPALPYLKRAIELDPGNFIAWDLLAHVQDRHLCQYQDAAASYRRAIAIEPLMPSPQYNLTRMLAEMGAFTDAAASVHHFTSVSRDPIHTARMRALVPGYSGDLSSSAVWLDEAIRLDSGYWGTRSGQMQNLRALGLVDAAIRSVPDLQRPLAVPFLRGDYATAAAAAIDIGDRIWTVQPAYLTLAMPALLRAGREDWLVQSFDRSFPSVEAFDQQLGCRQTVFFGPHLVLALQREGRHRDAALLLRLTRSAFRKRAEAGLRGPMQEVLRARLLALKGRNEAALTALDRAATLGWLDQFWPYFGMGDPLFDPIRRDPRFRAVEHRIQASVRRERAELADQMRSARRES